MQDVSYEPLILCPSENPQASLDIFSQPHHHPSRFLHPSQGDKQGLTFPFLWRTALQAAASYRGTILAHLLRRCTRLLMVLPSRQQSAMCSICPVRIVLEVYHM